MSDTIIKVENLGKKYIIGHQQEGRSNYVALRDVMANGAKSLVKRFTHPQNNNPNREEFWALKDVSFEIKQGECVGIIGRNGAGKSTLLKILSRITEPTTGRISIKGRVASLLEVGTGFHPELTGRENIYLNGAILGMSKAEIKKKFDEIVAFAEVEKFLDTPVKRYSSGMYVRLAFAVAAHLEPEILVVDEVLAVGDAAFQKKCLGKMGDVATKEGRTVLFVSHDMAAIENLCKIGILLDNGKIVNQGKPLFVINNYLNAILPSTIQAENLINRKDRSGNGKIRLKDFWIEDTKGNKLAAARSGTDIVFVFGYQCLEQEIINNVDVGFSIHSEKNQTLFVFYSSYVNETFNKVCSNGYFRCFVNQLPLSAGRYRVGARVITAGEEADWIRNGIGYLIVENGNFYGTGKKGFEGNSYFLVNGKWQIVSNKADRNNLIY